MNYTIQFKLQTQSPIEITNEDTMTGGIKYFKDMCNPLILSGIREEKAG